MPRVDRLAYNQYQREFKARRREQQRIHLDKTRQMYRDRGDCMYCGKNRSTDTMTCGSCREFRRLTGLRYNRKLKSHILKIYGGKCVCCGEDNHGFLTMDHPNNDGAAHRRETGCGTGLAFYQWLKNNNYPKEFQILCWNCNAGKRDNAGICPHKGIQERPV